MSGIFKSIKKIFKKVGKVIKKIAPYLIIAGAVYFGGSYLMSIYGGATAGAAGSAATSFTKSAGVWKSFLGGLTNGTAAQSAAAFAEGSYQASLGLNPLPLSGQVLAGTSSVNALNGVLSTKQAVTAGVDLAKGAWVQSGGDPQGMTNIVQKAWNQSQAINVGQLGIDTAGSSAITTVTAEETIPFISKGGGGTGGEYAYFNGKMQWVPEVPVTTTSSTVADAASADIVPQGNVLGTTDPGLLGKGAAQDYSTPTGATQLAAGGDRSMMQMMWEMDEKNRATQTSYNTSMLDLMKSQMAERKNANKNQLLWSMAQTGLKAMGGYMTASAERKEANRARNWRRKEDEPMWDPHTGEFSKGIITG